MRIRNVTPWEATKMDRDIYSDILIAVKSFMDDNPGQELCVETISFQSGYEPKDVKTVLYYHLFIGDLKCETYKKDGSMETFLKLYSCNFDGSPMKCATKDAHGNHCPEYPTKQFNGVRLCDQCYRNAKIQYGKEHNRKG